MIFIKEATTTEVAIGPFLDSTDGITPETGLTISASDIRLKIGAANWAAATNAATHEEFGWYRVDIASGEAVVGPIILSVQESGALPVWHEFMVIDGQAYDSLVSGSAQLWTTTTAMGAGVITAAAIATDAIDADAIAANAIDASALAADAVTEIQSGLATSAALATAQTDIDSIQVVTDNLVMAAGTIGATGNTTTTIHLPALTHADDAINSMLLGIFDVSTSQWHSRWISDWVNATKLATVALLPFTPQASTDLYAIYPVRADVTGGSGLDAAGVRSAIGMSSANMDTQLSGIQSDTNDIQARLPAALVSGRMDSSVGAMAADVVTASAIATDAIGSAELAASAVTEIQTGLATSAALATAQTDLDDIQTRLPAALVSGRMDASVGAMAAGVVTAAAVATDAIDSDAIAASAVTEIAAPVLAVLGALADAAADGDPTSADTLMMYVKQLVNTLVGTAGIPTFPASAVPANAVSLAESIRQIYDEVAGLNGGALPAAAPTAAAVADAVWDEALAGHLTAGSTGEALNAAGAAGDPWTTSLPGAYTGTQAGKIIGDLDGVETRLPAALVGGRMDSSVGAMAAGVVTAAAIATDAIDDDAIATGAIASTAFAAGAINAAAIAADAIGASELAADAVTEIAAPILAVLGGLTDAAVDGDPTTTDTVMMYVKQLVNTLVGTAGIPTFPASAIPANAVSLAEAIRQIYDEVSGLNGAAAGGLDAAGVRSAIGMASANMDTQLSGIQSDTNDIQTRLPAALVGGRMDASVGAMAAGVVTAAAVATDAIDSDAIAASAVTEIQTGLATAANLQLVDDLVDDLESRIGTPTNLGSGATVAANLVDIEGFADDIPALQTSINTVDDFLDTEVAAILAAVDTEVAAIKAKTDNLPTDPADASDIAASFTALNTKVDTIDDFIDTEVAAILAAVDTEVAAIKAKTDLIPADPADASDIAALIDSVPTANEVADQVWDETHAAHLSVGSTGAALSAASAADLLPNETEIADAVLKRDFSAVTGEAARSLLNANRFLRNKFTLVAGTLTVYEENDTTPAWTATYGTVADDPVRSIDPS